MACNHQNVRPMSKTTIGVHSQGKTSSYVVRVVCISCTVVNVNAIGANAHRRVRSVAKSDC